MTQAAAGRDDLVTQFEAERPRLRAMAYRMLGTLADADDAVQECWLRLARATGRAGSTAGTASTAAGPADGTGSPAGTGSADGTGSPTQIGNLAGWLTTTVSRICLDALRTRAARREDPWDAHVPDPIVVRDPAGGIGPDGALGGWPASSAGTPDPEQEAVLADSIGLALLVVLDTLAPAERLAFVLHDIFAVPFDRVAATLDRSPEAARQLASRARRRLREAPPPATDAPRQRQLVDAFLAAARDGNLDVLLDLLDPDVVLRADAGDGPLGPSRVVRGSAAVLSQARHYAGLGRFGRRALVNDAPGVAVVRDGRTLAVMGFGFGGGRITRIDILADPVRLDRLLGAKSPR